MNADEVVSALRCCNRSKGHRCSECPVFSRYEHRICKATVDRFAADLIESLQAQLAESQRREQVAVEDLKRFSACCQCNANIDGSCCDMFDGTAENKYFCSNWQRRGPQTGKGDAPNE